MRAIILVMAWLAPACAWAAPLPALTDLANGPARVSALVVDLDARQVLAQLSPDTRLTPASVSKLYTAAAALEQWGPMHRFTTRLLSDGRVQDGALAGDLVLLGAGDPDFDHARLWRLVAQLRQRGIDRIEGDLVINDSLFGPVPCVTKDRCEASVRSRHSYDAPLSAAGMNFSTVELSVLPAFEAGEPADLAFMPPGVNGFATNGQVETVTAEEPTSFWAWRATRAGNNILQITGQVPVDGGPFTVHRSVSSPSHYTAAVVESVLSTVGIGVAGGTRVDSRPPHPNLRTIAEVASPPLANQLRGMLAYSNNYMADTLTLDLAAYDGSAKQSDKPLTLPRAARRLEELAHRANQEAAGWLGQSSGEGPQLAIDTGSGLSVSSKLSARDVVALLTYMHGQNATFATYAGALSVPQFTHSSRLKDGNADWATRVAAKTGSLTEPVSVFGYAGYLRLADGGWGAFAVLVNGRSESRPVPTSKSIAAIRDDLEALLATN